jgi:hypothetical protein
MKTSKGSTVNKSGGACASKAGAFAGDHASYRELLATVEVARGIAGNKKLFGQLLALLERMELEIRSTGRKA